MALWQLVLVINYNAQQKCVCVNRRIVMFMLKLAVVFPPLFYITKVSMSKEMLIEKTYNYPKTPKTK